MVAGNVRDLIPAMVPGAGLNQQAVADAMSVAAARALPAQPSRAPRGRSHSGRNHRRRSRSGRHYGHDPRGRRARHHHRSASRHGRHSGRRGREHRRHGSSSYSSDSRSPSAEEIAQQVAAPPAPPAPAGEGPLLAAGVAHTINPNTYRRRAHVIRAGPAIHQLFFFRPEALHGQVFPGQLLVPVRD